MQAMMNQEPRGKNSNYLRFGHLLNSSYSSPTKSPLKKKRPPPGSPRKVLGARRKATENKSEKNEKNRMEEPEVDHDPDSGYKSPPKYDKDEVVRKMEEDDDEKIEEMIDDISTNEMFGSSILSMEN